MASAAQMYRAKHGVMPTDARGRTKLHQAEIEPGRSVVNNWDRELFETWEQRKARRARERDQQTLPPQPTA